MAEERTIDQVSSEDLFRGAMTPDPTPPAPEPPAQEPPGQEPPAPAPTPEPPTPTPPPAAAEHIPSWRLKEEADARRAAEDRARQLEERLNQIAAHQQQAKQPDFFENPDQATQTLVLRMLGPYAEEQRRITMYNSKMVASAVHGADKVDAAEEAFLKARDAQSLDPVDYERVVQSPNRYDAVVQWHKRHSVLSSVGDDPAAWFEKQLEARMADPQFQANMLQKINGGAAQRPGTVKLPTSLSRVPGASGNTGQTPGDMSDQSLWETATAGMPHKR